MNGARMNIINAVSSFHLGCPISIERVLNSKIFKHFKQSPNFNFLIIFNSARKRRIAVLFPSGKVCVILCKMDNADQQLHSFSKYIVRRIYRANGIGTITGPQLNNYKIENYCAKIEDISYSVDCKIKTENGGKVRFFSNGKILVTNCVTYEALEEALVEAKLTLVEKNLFNVTL